MGMNLHALVRGAINNVTSDESCILYQSLGQANDKGVVKTLYSKPKIVKVQIQPLDRKALQQAERMNDTKATMQAYLFSERELPVTAGTRLPQARSGDILQRNDGTYWLVTSVLEDWNSEGWAKVGITLQVIPPLGVKE